MIIKLGKRTFSRTSQAFTVLAMIISLAPAVQAAGNANAGRDKAAACEICHGKNGVSTNPSYPILAGQHASYLTRQLMRFKNKERVDAIMNEMSQSLSEQDIEDLASYFESLN